jgi:hypothetical protein
MPSLQISKLIEALKASANRKDRGLKQQLIAKGLVYPFLGKKRRIEVLDLMDEKAARWSYLTADDAINFSKEDRSR